MWWFVFILPYCHLNVCVRNLSWHFYLQVENSRCYVAICVDCAQLPPKRVCQKPLLLAFCHVQATRAELESPASDVGWAETEGDSSSLHRHCPGLETRWCKSCLREYLHQLCRSYNSVTWGEQSNTAAATVSHEVNSLTLLQPWKSAFRQTYTAIAIGRIKNHWNKTALCVSAGVIVVKSFDVVKPKGKFVLCAALWP